MRRGLGSALLALAVGVALAGPAAAQDKIRIGALFPLSGGSASAGQAAKAAVELAVEIVNSAHPELQALPLGATAGLPNLGGAKLELVFADNQGSPSVGQNQTLRLITEEKVAAMIGAYQSSVTFAATQVAERYGIPWIVGDSVATNITTRGFKWVFRTTPVAGDFADAYMRFLDDMKQAGRKVGTIAIVNENTDYGTSVAEVLQQAAKQHGYAVALQIPYSASSTDVSTQVLQLKQKQPDVVIFISYTADSILYLKTMKNLDYLPPLVIGDDSGFSDPTFLPAVGPIAQGAINRSAWDSGEPGSVAYRINELYKAKTGHELDDTSGRDMQAMLVLADAINRAGSAAPERIQKALQETDLKAGQLMMGYRGVKFDATGQNLLASTYLIQVQGGQYVAVWPPGPGVKPIQLPFKGWK